MIRTYKSTIIPLLLGLMLLPFLSKNTKETISITDSTKPETKIETLETPKQIPASPLQIKMSFAPLVKKVNPAVVSIKSILKKNQQHQTLAQDDLNKFLFGQPPGNQSPPHRQDSPTSMGSGVIIDPQGYIVTCAHVIQNAEKISIRLSDNREFSAQIANIDHNNDLAILKIVDEDSKSPLPFLALGKSGSLEVGDLVLAIGNPFGVGQTVTDGIVSALARNIRGRILIQTNASINPGNSGGALIDFDGKLIGIPNAILSKTGASIGIGFAIPVSVIKPLLTAVQKGEKIKRPWDGLLLQTLSPDRAESFRMKDGRGAFIVQVHPESPASKAGIQKGDVIIAVNGIDINTAEDYVLKMQDVEIGTLVPVKILRKGEEIPLIFELITPPRIPEPHETILEGKNILKGIKVANLSPDFAIEHGFDLNRSGVVIMSMSAENGKLPLSMAPGDVIIKLNDREIKTIQDLQDEITNPFREIVVGRGLKEIRIIATHSPQQLSLAKQKTLL